MVSRMRGNDRTGEVRGDDGQTNCGREPLSRTSRAPQIRRNTSEPFVPPKPNEFDIATSTCFSRAVCGT